MFKKGDKVVCIDSSDMEKILTKDTVYEVLELEGFHGIYVLGDNGESEFAFNFRFKLVEEEPQSEPIPDGEADYIIQISHPKHYSSLPIEPIDFILANNLSFHQGCIIKYACRYDKKGTPKEDLEKIIYYAQHLLKEVEAKEAK